ncbi:F-box protein At3g07870-like isoform X2 [Carica papaya]|uniref:F-box protein At3g07870-like isoform X2 n=1 Tax=Carica papaya TaxID=3649 RepID=UPI000B8C74B6|nr:F-box protein At3g07870-like isoform X2 [Carica papaya]
MFKLPISSASVALEEERRSHPEPQSYMAAVGATYLPDEITIRILARLPVKTLMTCKSVCKVWYNLINQPALVDMHLHQSTVDSKNNKEQESFLAINTDTTLRKHVVNLLTQETHSEFIYLNIPYEKYACITLIGCCNGLLCVRARKSSDPAADFYFINPAIRESKAICSTMKAADSKGCFGVGYDSVNKDYKLVRVTGFINNEGKNCSKAEVWTLYGNSWRGADNTVEGEVRESSCKAVVNGAFHWQAVRVNRQENSKTFLIVSFDISNEVFGEMMSPDFGYAPSTRSLSACKGSLAMFVSYMDANLDSCYDIWLMKEYGVAESWTNQFTIKPFTIMKPLGFGNSGELLVALKDGAIGLYDPCTGKTKPFSIQAGPIAPYMLNYVESLVTVMRQNGFRGRFELGAA